MTIQDRINQLEQFRKQVYESLKHRKDSLMDLLDALCGNQGAKSVVELSLNPLFRRGYSALYAAISALGKLGDSPPASVDVGRNMERPPDRFPSAWIEAIAGVVPPPEQRSYWLFGLDVTAVGRCHAVTMKDRESVYQPTAISGQKPITLGHNYSLLAAIPELESAGGLSWIVPASVERVSSFDSKTSVGIRQVNRLLKDESLPWHSAVCVLVVDSEYCHRGFLYPFSTTANRAIVSRCRSNRVFYRLPATCSEPKRGHPRWYGERFALKDETTWHPPERYETFTITTAKGKTRTVTLRLWHNLLMRGSRAQPMHHHPFDLLQVQVSDPTGKRIFKPQWLIVFGPARRQLSSQDAYQSYAERFKLEHAIRFGKQHLLLDQFQTPDVKQEENWVQFAWLAYVQLWVARWLAHLLPHPWQQYLPSVKQGQITPSTVQRDFTRLIRQIGTPAPEVKPRGKSPGRPVGTTLAPRPRRPTIKRGRAKRKKNKKAA